MAFDAVLDDHANVGDEVGHAAMFCDIRIRPL